MDVGYALCRTGCDTRRCARASCAAVQLAKELSLGFFGCCCCCLLAPSHQFGVLSIGPTLAGGKLAGAHQFVSAIFCGARFGRFHQRRHMMM